MHGHGVVAPDALQHHQGLAAVHQKVVGDDLQPVQGLWGVQEIVVVRRAQAQAKTQADAGQGGSGGGLV
ncbi:hypothetical protein D3C85_1839240 [compost metagenome]